MESKYIVPMFDDARMEESHSYLNHCGHSFTKEETYASVDHNIENLKGYLKDFQSGKLTSLVDKQINYLLEKIETHPSKFGCILDGSYVNFRILIGRNYMGFSSLYELKQRYPDVYSLIGDDNFPDASSENYDIFKRVVDIACAVGEKILVSFDRTTGYSSDFES